MKKKKFTNQEIKQRNIENYGSKIKKYRARVGLSAEQLANILDVSKASVTNWECGLTRPDLDNLFQMFKIFDVAPNEFFGISEVGTALTPQERSIIKVFRTLDEEEKHDADAIFTTLSNRSLKKRNHRILASVCPILDRDIPVSAGAVDGWPDPCYDNDHKMLLRNDYVVQRADEIYTVNGDSMEPQFHNGEKVLVEHTSCVMDGDIGIFNVDKRGLVIKQKAYDHLHSLNKEYDDIYPYDLATPIGRVIGKVDEHKITPEEERRYWEAKELQKDLSS